MALKHVRKLTLLYGVSLPFLHYSVIAVQVFRNHTLSEILSKIDLFNFLIYKIYGVNNCIYLLLKLEIFEKVFWIFWSNMANGNFCKKKTYYLYNGIVFQ